jgi:ABC-type branched-subunit amino acid transport system permease subunit
VPRLFQLPGHRSSLGLFDAHIWTAITASGALRALYGFLTLFFAFRTREDDLGLPPAAALATIVVALGVGSFLSTVAGARIWPRRSATACRPPSRWRSSRRSAAGWRSCPWTR